MKKLMEVLFANRIAMKFWMWRYNRRMKNFNFDKWLMSDED